MIIKTLHCLPPSSLASFFLPGLSFFLYLLIFVLSPPPLSPISVSFLETSISPPSLSSSAHHLVELHVSASFVHHHLLLLLMLLILESSTFSSHPPCVYTSFHSACKLLYLRSTDSFLIHRILEIDHHVLLFSPSFLTLVFLAVYGYVKQ